VISAGFGATGATTVGTGETGPQLLGWVPTMYVGPDPIGEKEKQLITVVMRRHSQ